MFSKILIKLVDQAIVPAIVLLASRVLSLVFISSYYRVPYTFDARGVSFASGTDFVLVNSYSVLFMIVVIAVGILFMLLKAYFLHDTHIAPHVTAKMYSLRLSAFIQSSFDLYSQGAIWLSYLYLMVFVSGILAFFGFIYAWIFIVAIVLGVISSVFLVIDVERELFSEYKNTNPDIVIDFGDN
ncbi:MAG: hypothetical protein R3B92_02165 [Patescibacteria group bacterium]|uniref:Uncharacterized protein n=1 Tax=candidate division WWE3 bacterium TaxID=2053526 RepID=A0A955J1Z0_UNCKA|nr:hypothetical protein [candidate division WWE3 bacterium]